MKKWIIITAALVVVIAWIGYSAVDSGESVEVATAETGPIYEFVEQRGKTRLPKVYLITMPQDGRVEAIDLVENTPIIKGQVLARIVPRDPAMSVAAAQAIHDRLVAAIQENDDVTVETTLKNQAKSFVLSMKAAVDAAQARMVSGEAKLKYAQADLERVERLWRQGAKTDDDHDQAKLGLVESQVDYQQDKLVHRATDALYVATAMMPKAIDQYISRKSLTRAVLLKQLAEAKVHLDQAKQQEQRSVMRSPIDGVVLERLASNERQITAGTILLKIGDLKQLQIETDVLSQNVVNVQVGDRAEINGPTIGPTPAKGVVVRIHPAGFTKISTLGVEQQRVKVVLQLADGELQRLREQRNLGVDYRVGVRIFTREKDEALMIPRSALFRDALGVQQVFVVQDQIAKKRSVTVGLVNDTKAEIVTGVKVGDRVVVAPESNLADGVRVHAKK